VGVEEHTIEIGGADVFYRAASTPGATPVYLHSAPTSGGDWVEMLELTGGVAPDLPGFGRSHKPGHLDYSFEGYVRFIEELLDALELPEATLVGHGWGAAFALAFAQRHPDRVARLAAIDAIGLLETFRWPRVARLLRRPALGELIMGSLTRGLLARTLRAGSTDPETWSDARVETVWEQFDQGTQRAILRLLRSVDERSLAAAGAGLDELTQPALIAWGERDPWLPPALADEFGRRLPRAMVLRVPDAGHWPWLDQPELREQLAAFTGGDTA
jgi:pimeloyl-ACP methyl ester carboxylesterase